MNAKHDINGVFLSKKLCIGRTLLFLNYSIGTLSKADLEHIGQDHINALDHISEHLILVRKDMDKLLENDPEIFNIEPSVKD
jgi:hypothetical protein